MNIEMRIMKDKDLYFIVSGEGMTFKSYGVAVNEKAAKKFMRQLRKEMYS